MSLAHQNRKIVDRDGNITLTLGVGHNYAEAWVEWYDSADQGRSPMRQCWIDSNLLLLGRWVSTREGGDEPPIAVVCRATAIAVGAAIKADVTRAVESLP